MYLHYSLNTGGRLVSSLYILSHTENGVMSRGKRTDSNMLTDVSHWVQSVIVIYV